MNPQTYVPGTCNIGPKEREKRQRMGLAGLMLTCGWTFLGYVWVFPLFLKMLVFIPAFISAIGFIQYNSGFCAWYGFREQQNTTDNILAVKVLDPKSNEADRSKAAGLTLVALIIAFLYSILVVLLF